LGALGAKALARRAETPTAKAKTTNTTFFIMLSCSKDEAWFRIQSPPAAPASQKITVCSAWCVEQLTLLRNVTSER
jgi:hypothetical protein